MDSVQDEMVLRTSKKRQIIMVLLGPAFALLGVLAIMSDLWYGWLLGGLGVLVTPLMIRQMAMGGSYLKINQDGFVVGILKKEESYRWDDIEEFYPVTIAFMKYVGWSFVPEFDQTKLTKGLPAGGDTQFTLPECFGEDVDKLAGLMNDYLQTRRDAAGQS
jgi:hypothetical protein